MPYSRQLSSKGPCAHATAWAARHSNPPPLHLNCWGFSCRVQVRAANKESVIIPTPDTSVYEPPVRPVYPLSSLMWQGGHLQPGEQVAM